jgi:hypothetical protein
VAITADPFLGMEVWHYSTFSVESKILSLIKTHDLVLCECCGLYSDSYIISSNATF